MNTDPRWLESQHQSPFIASAPGSPPSTASTACRLHTPLPWGSGRGGAPGCPSHPGGEGVQELFLALSPGNSAVSLNHFQLHKRLPGSLQRPLSSEAPQPENASPACLRGWPLEAEGTASGRLPAPAPGPEMPPFRSIQADDRVPLLFSLGRAPWRGVHTLNRRWRMGRPTEPSHSRLTQK